jgi:hypothetical protein
MIIAAMRLGSAESVAIRLSELYPDPSHILFKKRDLSLPGSPSIADLLAGKSKSRE